MVIIVKNVQQLVMFAVVGLLWCVTLVFQGIIQIIGLVIDVVSIVQHVLVPLVVLNVTKGINSMRIKLVFEKLI